MSEHSRVWVGADPGGKNNFGVAILLPDGSAHTRCVSFADEAVDVVYGWLDGSSPTGVGVDAPLWWSSGRSGGRFVDQDLRDTYGLSGGQVQAPNSLRGAALAQGAMFVLRIRERYPKVGVTETHPKALLVALDMTEGEAFWYRFSVDWSSAQRPEHERDALISAVAAREGFEGRWSRDLSKNRYPSEQDPSESWLGPVHYYWPPQEP
jgi:predicted nuclease with RNAse H fold